jgi:hypothetical protein
MDNVHKEDVNYLRRLEREDNRAFRGYAGGKNGMLQIFTPDYYKQSIPIACPLYSEVYPSELLDRNDD